MLGTGLVAVDAAGEILGTAMWWSTGAEAGTLGMVLVAPAQQGKGVGRALTQAAIGSTGRRALMLNATEAGLRLYDSLGFRAAGAVRQHQGRLVTSPRPTTVSARPFETADSATLTALDAAAFGAPRAALLDHLLRIGHAMVLETVDGVSGFAIRRAFGRGQVIGPLVAANEEDAIALVAAIAAPGLLRVDIPAEATRLAGWLSDAGLPCIDSATTMLCGTWPERSLRPRGFALVSQALG